MSSLIPPRRAIVETLSALNCWRYDYPMLRLFWHLRPETAP